MSNYFTIAYFIQNGVARINFVDFNIQFNVETCDLFNLPTRAQNYLQNHVDQLKSKKLHIPRPLFNGELLCVTNPTTVSFPIYIE